MVQSEKPDGSSVQTEADALVRGRKEKLDCTDYVLGESKACALKLMHWLVLSFYSSSSDQSKSEIEELRNGVPASGRA